MAQRTVDHTTQLTPELLGELGVHPTFVQAAKEWMQTKVNPDPRSNGKWTTFRPTRRNLKNLQDFGFNIYWIWGTLPIAQTPKMLKIACMEAEWAYMWAEYIDKKPRAETRIAASKKAPWALAYAIKIDKQPTAVTRKGACKEPLTATLYANKVDRQATAETLAAALKDAEASYQYAMHVVSRKNVYIIDALREGACSGNPLWGFYFARDIDRGPHELTRKACFKEPAYTLKYAKYIDKHLREDSYKVLSKNDKLKAKAEEIFGKQ